MVHDLILRESATKANDTEIASPIMSKYQHPKIAVTNAHTIPRGIVLTGHGLTATKAVSATTVLSETSVLVLAIMVVVTLRTTIIHPSKTIYGQSTHVTNVVDPSSADLICSSYIFFDPHLDRYT
jgi:hypothetical protein